MSRYEIDLDNILLLSRLYLSDTEKNSINDSLEAILAHLDKLSEVNVEGVEPSAHIFPLYNVLRDDAPGQPWDSETALLNAPQQRDDQVIVPKVVE